MKKILVLLFLGIIGRAFCSIDEILKQMEDGEKEISQCGQAILLHILDNADYKTVRDLVSQKRETYTILLSSEIEKKLLSNIIATIFHRIFKVKIYTDFEDHSSKFLKYISLEIFFEEMYSQQFALLLNDRYWGKKYDKPHCKSLLEEFCITLKLINSFCDKICLRGKAKFLEYAKNNVIFAYKENYIKNDILNLLELIYEAIEKKYKDALVDKKFECKKELSGITQPFQKASFPCRPIVLSGTALGVSSFLSIKSGRLKKKWNRFFTWCNHNPIAASILVGTIGSGSAYALQKLYN